MLINPTVLKAEEVRTAEPALLAEWSSTLRISSAQEVSGGSGHHHPDDGAFPRGTPQAGRAHVHVHRVGLSTSSLQPSLLCGALPPPESPPASCLFWDGIWSHRQVLLSHGCFSLLKFPKWSPKE